MRGLCVWGGVVGVCGVCVYSHVIVVSMMCE